MRNQGVPDHEFDGRPVIGICNTWSELTPCNAHFRDLAESVKKGILTAGGFPLEFPITSLGEPLMKPTAMMFRNLAAMDAEETIRAKPLDGVVLLVGCDKTTPSAMMGAASVDLPTIVVSGGAMLNGKYRGNDIGSGTHIWKFSEDLRAGRMTEQEFAQAEGCMSRSSGGCMTMGTASTMACMIEALGKAPPMATVAEMKNKFETFELETTLRDIRSIEKKFKDTKNKLDILLKEKGDLIDWQGVGIDLDILNGKSQHLAGLTGYVPTADFTEFSDSMQKATPYVDVFEAWKDDRYRGKHSDIYC